MPTLTVGNKFEVIHPRGQGPAVIVNLDLVNSVYISRGQGITTASEQIPPLGSVAVLGNRDVYAATLSPSVNIALQIIPDSNGSSPSPYQIAQQTQALLQPELQIAAAEDLDGSLTTYTLVTFAAKSRIWMLDLVEGISTNTSYTGVNREHITIGTTDLGALLQIELVLADSVGLIASMSKTAAFANPLPVASGDSVIISASGGTTYTTRRIAGSVLYSTP